MVKSKNISRKNLIFHLSTACQTFVSKIDTVIILIFTFSLLFRLLVPANLAINSPHDDFLGVELANSLLNLDWLGAWNNRTLAKPPGYSFFLLFNHFTGINPVVTLHIFYLVLSLIFSKNLAILIGDTKPKDSRRFSFLILAFNPVVFAGEFSRIYRVSLNTLLAFAFIIVILLIIIHAQNQKMDFFKDKRNVRKLYKYVTLLGFIYSGMVLTRSEAYWLLMGPCILLIFFTAIYILQRNFKFASLRREVSTFALCISIFFIAWQTPLGIVGTINQSIYGVNLVEDFFTGNFAKAIKNWESVSEGRSELKFIPVSKAQRAVVYEVSPTAMAMKPILDGLPNTGWKTFNCQYTKICDESGGGWFPWELRDAAVSTFNIKSEKEFQSIFGKLSNEIEMACTEGKISCDAGGLAPGTQPLTEIPKRQIVDSSILVLSSLFNLDQAANVARVDTGQDSNQIAIWDRVTNSSYVITNENNSWITLSSVIKFLTVLYKYLVIFGFFLLFVYISRKLATGFMLFWIFSIAISIFTFCIGIGILQISTGVGLNYGIYALPSQLVFFTLPVIGLTQFLSRLDN